MEDSSGSGQAELSIHGKTAIGLKQTLKAATSGCAVTVYIARDADRRLTARLEFICRERGISLQWVDSMKLLGKAFGIDVGAAAAAILSH